MDSLNVKQLQDELRKRGLLISGSKRTLIKRINDYDRQLDTGETLSHSDEIVNQQTGQTGTIEEETRNITTISDSGTATDEELRAREWSLIKRERDLLEKEKVLFVKEREIAEKLRHLDSATRFRDSVPERPRVNCTIREIADALPVFSPGDITSMSAECWINRVECLKNIYGWDEMALLLAASSRMHGPARHWWDSCQEVSTSWTQLATGLKSNFPHHCSEVEVHQQLMKRTRKPSETIDNFCFEMNLIGKRIDLSDKTIIQYILTGLNDTQMSTTLAAGNFSNIAELVEKIKWYQGIRINSRQANNLSAPRFVTSPRPSTSESTKWQPNRQPVPKNPISCYKCNQPGHFAKNCIQSRKRHWDHDKDQNPATKTEKNYRVNVIVNNDNGDCYHKDVFVHGKRYAALLDSGSEKTIITKRVATDVNGTIEKCETTLHGFGGGSCRAIGSIKCQIQIDGALFPVHAVVVDDSCLSKPVLIGKDVLNNPICNMRKQGDSLTVQRMDVEVSSSSPISASDVQLGEEVETPVLVKLLNEYRKCIAMNQKELGRTKLIEMEIELVKQDPIVHQPYKVPYAKRQILTTMISDLMKSGLVIESQSDYASPVVLVKKKNGEDRMCVDYRKLNSITKKIRYPMPLIEEQLNDLAGYKYFCVLDLASGYYQIPIKKEHTHYTAFITHDGLYEFTSMPFGLVNAPSIFQKLMNTIVRKMKPVKIVCYMDDVVIPSETFEEGVEKLETFLKILKDANLTLNLRKCVFFKKEIEFLGHLVKDGTIQPGKTKTMAVEKFETPENEHEVRQFIGLTSYFRKFIENYSLIALPLTNLTKKNCMFQWGQQEDNAFKTLKNCLINKPLLALYNPNSDHELHTDASSHGIAGVLLQRENNSLHPVAYYSRKTSKDESFFHSYELEALAVVESTYRFRQFLLGKYFKIITDCEALKTAMNKKELIPRIARWWLKMLEFDYEINHRSGKLMQHVDTLSRHPNEDAQEPDVVEMNVLKISIDDSDWLYSLQLQDESIAKIAQCLKKPPNNVEEKQMHIDYLLKDGRVYRRDENNLRLYVPKGVRNRVLTHSHDMMGHFSERKTLDHLKSRYWFPRMRQVVKKYLKSCVECAYNSNKVQPRGELHLIEKKDIPFDTVHIDHLGPFIKSTKGNSYLIVVVDAFTKYTIMKALPSTQTKPVLNFLTESFYSFGAPRRIISDRGTSFTSKMFENFIKDFGIIHVQNATRTPRANGQVERYNRTILQALLASVEDEDRWDQKVKPVQWALNNTYNESIGKTAQQMLMGYIPRDPWPDVLAQQIELNQHRNLEIIRSNGLEHITKIQSKQKSQHDNKYGKAKQYNVGDLVMSKNDAVNSSGSSRKLEAKYKGPYVVVAKLPHDRYQIADIPFAQRNQKPYSSVWAADRMKSWIEFDEELDEGVDDDSMAETVTETATLE